MRQRLLTAVQKGWGGCEGMISMEQLLGVDILKHLLGILHMRLRGLRECSSRTTEIGSSAGVVVHGALVHLPVALQHAASLQREVLQRRLRRRDHEHHLPVDHPQRSPPPSAWHRGACRHKVPAPRPRLRLP